MVAQPDPTPTLTIRTVRLGTPETLSVQLAQLYTFGEALPGLPDSHRYALIVDADYEPLRWLQSLDDGAVCLPVMPLNTLRIDQRAYAEQVKRAVEYSGRQEILLVTQFDGAGATLVANLLAPIVLDQQCGTGCQVILDERAYALRQKLVWDAAAREFDVPC